MRMLIEPFSSTAKCTRTGWWITGMLLICLSILYPSYVEADQGSSLKISDLDNQVEYEKTQDMRMPASSLLSSSSSSQHPTNPNAENNQRIRQRLPILHEQPPTELERKEQRSSRRRRLGRYRPWNSDYTTVEDFVQSNPHLSTLEALLVAADLQGILDRPTPDVTLLAPLNSAFDALPREFLSDLLAPENQSLLQEILFYHFIPGATLRTCDLDHGLTTGIPTTLSEFAGDAFTMSAYKTCHWWHSCEVSFDNGAATVVGPDRIAENGVVHVIDAVLIPPPLRGVVAYYYE